MNAPVYHRSTYYLLDFIQYLRAHDFFIGSGDMLTAVVALREIGFASEQNVRLTLRTVFCAHVNDRQRFDALFTAYFFPSESTSVVTENSSLSTTTSQNQVTADGEPLPAERTGTTKGYDEASLDIGDDRDTSTDSRAEELSFLERARYSSERFLNKQSLTIPSDQLQDMFRITQRFIQHYQRLLARRWQPVKQGRRLDFRRTFRKNIGAPAMLQLQWKGPTKQQANFVLLCDGSRSMMTYADKFLQFAYTLTRQARKAETYLFSTRMRRMTPWLLRGTDHRLPQLTHLSETWGGGTRIGESLAAFVRRDGLRMLSKHTVVILFSDGVDQGDPMNLKWALRYIQKQSLSFIWLNPLATDEHYRPETKGMKAALPYIDGFAGVREHDTYADLLHMLGNGGISDERKSGRY